MGKAKIYQHLGDGRYTIQYQRNVARAATRIKELKAIQDGMNKALYSKGGLIDQRDAALPEIDNRTLEFEIAVQAWADCQKDPNCKNGDELMKVVKAAAEARLEAQSKYYGLLEVIASINAKKYGIDLEVGQLQSTTTDRATEVFDVWSIDCPHETCPPIPVSTVVGTIETFGIKGSRFSDLQLENPHINTRAAFGGSGSYAYNATRDHIAEPVMANTTSGAIMGHLQLGWAVNQNPEHAVGTLTSINRGAHTCSVTITGLTPTSGSFTPFTERNFSNVSIVYQDCHSGAFNVGDKVIVKFGAKYSTPMVIGFAENPRPCRKPSSWEIAGGSYARNYQVGGFTWQGTPEVEAGNIAWRGANGLCVSWYGRVGIHVGPAAGACEFVFYNGTGYFTEANCHVRGAFAEIVSSVVHLYALVDDWANKKMKLYKLTMPSGPSTKLQEWNYTTAEATMFYRDTHPIFFNLNATKGISLRRRRQADTGEGASDNDVYAHYTLMEDYVWNGTTMTRTLTEKTLNTTLTWDTTVGQAGNTALEVGPAPLGWVGTANGTNVLLSRYFDKDDIEQTIEWRTYLRDTATGYQTQETINDITYYKCHMTSQTYETALKLFVGGVEWLSIPGEYKSNIKVVNGWETSAPTWNRPVVTGALRMIDPRNPEATIWQEAREIATRITDTTVSRHYEYRTYRNVDRSNVLFEQIDAPTTISSGSQVMVGEYPVTSFSTPDGSASGSMTLSYGQVSKNGSTIVLYGMELSTNGGFENATSTNDVGDVMTNDVLYSYGFYNLSNANRVSSSLNAAIDHRGRYVMAYGAPHIGGFYAITNADTFVSNDVTRSTFEAQSGKSLTQYGAMGAL